MALDRVLEYLSKLRKYQGCHMNESQREMIENSDLSEPEKQYLITMIDSVKRGKRVRRRCVLWCALWLIGVLISLVALDVSDGILIAGIIVFGSLCVVWAAMTLSASMNVQFDTITTLLKQEE